ncbi:MAG: NUDIX domain-containing protein [Acidobacteriota bacterium]
MTNAPKPPKPKDYDPHAVEIRPAATVLLVTDRPDLHVLMVHRAAKVVFAPDSWVFPGGRVDPEDHLDDFEVLCAGLSDEKASEILDVERGGLAWWIAACRETLEEAGLLLAAGGPVAPQTVSEVRKRVLEDESAFPDVLLEQKIRLDVTAIEEIARFITPLGPPRRFDARFLVAHAPEGQEPVHDEGEIVNWSWIRPAEALERWAAGEMQMMSPTVRMVACLARFERAEEVMEVARQRLDYQRVRVHDPQGEYRVVLPGEPDYETADLEVETGWVRLWRPAQA